LDLAFAHNEIEKTEKHFYIKAGYVDFYSSQIKKFGYFNIFKYGFVVNRKHNLILDFKNIHINTKLPKDLNVKKYFLGYQLNYSKFRGIFNFLYVDDNLLEEVDNIKTFGLGIGYKQLEAKGYLTKFKNFDVFQTDFKYFFIHKNFRSMVLLKTINISEKEGISQKAKRNYLVFGFFSHYILDKYHFGFNTILGKRTFAILDNGSNLEHHPLEFKYTVILKIGRKLPVGTFHIGSSFSEATELPFNNDTKINRYFLDYSVRF
jgi:hypothetical protein